MDQKKRSFWHRTLFSLCLTSSLFFLPQAFAETKEFVVGVQMFDALPHYSYKEGNYTGYAREILDLFSQKTGHKFKFVGFPVKRLYQNFVEGSIDFKYPDHEFWSSDLKEEWAKKKNYKISYVPLTEYVEGVMVLPEKAGKGQDTIKSLGTILGFNSPTWDKIVATGKTKYSPNPDMEGLINQALAGRVDGIFLDASGAKHKMKGMGLEGKLVFDSSLPYDSGEFKFSSWKHPEVMEQLKKFMEEEKAAVDALKKKYGLNKESLMSK